MGQNHKTTAIADAIIADGLPAPKAESLLMVHIRGGYIWSAIKSMIVSLYEGVKNIGIAILNCLPRVRAHKNTKDPIIIELDVVEKPITTTSVLDVANPGIFNSYTVDNQFPLPSTLKESDHLVVTAAATFNQAYQ